MAKYQIGQEAILRGAFEVVATEAPVDPTTVRVLVRKPDNTEQTLTFGVDGAVVKDSVGQYHCSYLCTMAGRYYYRWVGTGSGAAADEKKFDVAASAFEAPL